MRKVSRETICMYRSPMYVQRLILSSGNVALFNKKEFSMYTLRHRCCRNSLHISTRT